jgi:SAM-dependent methyltransferase
MVDTSQLAKHWDTCFHSGEWERNHGREQTAGFMHLLLETIPADMLAILHGCGITIGDIGCALGDGAAVLAQRLPDAIVVGYDIAPAGLLKAQMKYPEITFLPMGVGEPLPGLVDIGICSNVLEHLHHWRQAMALHMIACKYWYLAMVPYNENPVDGYAHLHTMTEETFPERIGVWVREWAEVTESTSFWGNMRQMVVGYRCER